MPNPTNLAAFPKIALPANQLVPLKSSVEVEVRSMLGLTGAAPLPVDVAKAIDAAIDAASHQQLAAQINRIASKHASKTVGPKMQLDQALKSKLALGLTGVKAVSQSAEYQAIVKENAVMLKAKYDALVAVGFTADQAFRLIEAEVEAKGAPRGGR